MKLRRAAFVLSSVAGFLIGGFLAVAASPNEYRKGFVAGKDEGLIECRVMAVRTGNAHWKPGPDGVVNDVVWHVRVTQHEDAPSMGELRPVVE